MNLLYYIFIFPIEQILSLFFVVVYRIFENNTLSYGLSVMGVSFVFSIITLPLYFMAEKFQHAERDIQARMKPDIDTIKSVFSGNERFMRLAVYYRHNGYHPLYSLRTSISLLIQVPFFMAAYHFLSNLEALKGVPFGPISDLAKPDSLVQFNGFSVNILPVIMTVINWGSSTLYTKGFSKRDKIQLYGISLIFLVLLYNSPAGLLVYWTCNNMFSLIKNIFQKIKHSKIVLNFMASALCIFASIYLLILREGISLIRVILALLLISVPFLLFFPGRLFKNKIMPFFDGKEKSKFESINIFLLSAIVIFLLGGLVIPSSLIASSVQEFSFIENNASPIPFIVNILAQALGLFVLIPMGIYLMLPRNYKEIFSKIVFVLSVIFIINAFVFQEDYGPITILFYFSTDNEPVSKTITLIINLLANSAAVILFLFLYRFKKVISSILAIFVCTFMVMGTINLITINKEFNSFRQQKQYESENADYYQNIYKLSKNGKNVVLIMLDMAVSGYVPFIFEEKPELYESFEGFTWYRNTVSFGEHTVFGAPGIYGGYEYTPLEMQSRNETPLVEKHNEALLLLPKLFLDNGYKVTITDPPYANYSEVSDISIFNDYPDIYADNIIGMYTKQWLSDIEYEIDLTNITDVINSYLLRFSVFKFVPLVFRDFVYDEGKWLTMGFTKIKPMTLYNYIALDILENVTEIAESDINTYSSIYNLLTHEPDTLNYPDYTYSKEAKKENDGFFADDERYHVHIASLMLLGKWFDFLKRNNVYDNTRIIIVSDHGVDLHGSLPDDYILPDGKSLWYFTAFLMVKDFDSHEKLLIDNTFMTNADVPLLALKDIIKDPVNPWTGKLLTANKIDGVDITDSEMWDIKWQNKNTFSIKKNEWMHVHDDIYDMKDWDKVDH